MTRPESFRVSKDPLNAPTQHLPSEQNPKDQQHIVAMPHATASVMMRPLVSAEEDIILPDALPQSMDDSNGENEQKVFNGPGSSLQSKNPTEVAPKSDVKIENIFTDDEEYGDEDFSGSEDTNRKVASSPPGAPV